MEHGRTYTVGPFTIVPVNQASEGEYRDALRREPEDCEALVGLAYWLARHGRRDEGIRELQAALERHPDDDRPHLMLAAILHEAGRLEEALAAYREAIRLGWNDAWVHLTVGDLLEQCGRGAEARQEWEAALEQGLAQQEGISHSSWPGWAKLLVKLLARWAGPVRGARKRLSRSVR
jgi:tetratricopeptide (TPR) repeat protein